MKIRPCTIKRAIDFNRKFHRRLPKIQGGMFAVRLTKNDHDIGVAIVGHPSRVYLEKGILQVLRCCVLDNHKNACSMLYGACSRAARSLGATDLVTYTHSDEDGASLRAANFVFGGYTDGGEWNRNNRQRSLAIDGGKKKRWFAPWGDKAKKIQNEI